MVRCSSVVVSTPGCVVEKQEEGEKEEGCAA